MPKECHPKLFKLEGRGVWELPQLENYKFLAYYSNNRNEKVVFQISSFGMFSFYTHQNWFPTYNSDWKENLIRHSYVFSLYIYWFLSFLQLFYDFITGKLGKLSLMYSKWIQINDPILRTYEFSSKLVKKLKTYILFLKLADTMSFPYFY